MISHRDQLDGPLAYLAAASASFAYPSVAVHSVERPAAAGLLPAELQRSLMFFFNWLSGEVPPRLGSATFDPPGPVGTGTLADGAITAKVIRLEPDFGNLELDLSLGALAALGVKMGDRVGIRAGGQVRIARVVDRFAGVARGDWAVVAIPSGELRVAVFMDNASKNLGVGIGETIELVPVKAD